MSLRGRVLPWSPNYGHPSGVSSPLDLDDVDKWISFLRANGYSVLAPGRAFAVLPIRISGFRLRLVNEEPGEVHSVSEFSEPASPTKALALNRVYLYIGFTESLAWPVVGAVMRRGSGAAASVTVKHCSEVRWLQLNPGVRDTYWIDAMSGEVVMFSIDLETVTGHQSEVAVEFLSGLFVFT